MFAQSLKDLTSLGYVKGDTKASLRPVQRAVKQASAAINESPWRDHAVPPGRGTVRRRPHPHNVAGLGLQTKGFTAPADPWEPSSAVSGSGLSSGYQTPLPATPHSAALGPMATATLGTIPPAAIPGGTQLPPGPVPSGPQLPPSYFSNIPSLERAKSVSSRSVSRSVSQRR